MKEKNGNKEPVVEKKSDNNRQILEEIARNKAKEEKRSFFSHFVEKIKDRDLSLFKSGVKGIVREYEDYKTSKGVVLEKYSAYETVVAGATDSAEYYILLILSCLIATIGLYQNSPAVIIGAMIVAPLMGPIFGFSAGVLWGSFNVVLEAVTTLLKGTVLVLAVTAGLSFVIPGIVVTGEMMSRSIPTLFDIIVALCCGLVGAFAYVNRRISSAIPGVAISVALMPPLCTIGIGLGLMNWEMARGAALLFAANLIGISFSSVIVFYLVKLHPQSEDEKEFSRARVRAVKQIVISILILVALSIPLVFFTTASIKANIEKEAIIQILKTELAGSKIYSMESEKTSVYKIEAIILGQKGDRSYNTGAIENKLKQKLNYPVQLQLYSMPELINIQPPGEKKKEQPPIKGNDEKSPGSGEPVVQDITGPS